MKDERDGEWPDADERKWRNAAVEAAVDEYRAANPWADDDDLQHYAQRVREEYAEADRLDAHVEAQLDAYENLWERAPEVIFDLGPAELAALRTVADAYARERVERALNVVGHDWARYVPGVYHDRLSAAAVAEISLGDTNGRARFRIFGGTPEAWLERAEAFRSAVRALNEHDRQTGPQAPSISPAAAPTRTGSAARGTDIGVPAATAVRGNTRMSLGPPAPGGAPLTVARSGAALLAAFVARVRIAQWAAGPVTERLLRVVDRGIQRGANFLAARTSWAGAYFAEVYAQAISKELQEYSPGHTPDVFRGRLGRAGEALTPLRQWVRDETVVEAAASVVGRRDVVALAFRSGRRTQALDVVVYFNVDPAPPRLDAHAVADALERRLPERIQEVASRWRVDGHQAVAEPGSHNHPSESLPASRPPQGPAQEPENTPDLNRQPIQDAEQGVRVPELAMQRSVPAAAAHERPTPAWDSLTAARPSILDAHVPERRS